MSKIKWDSSHIDVTEDVRAALTDKVNAVYIPLGASLLMRTLLLVDESGYRVRAADILDGNTMFDTQKMLEYSAQWKDSNIPSLYSDVCFAHIDQKSVDAILRKIDSEVIVTISEGE